MTDFLKDLTDFFERFFDRYFGIFGRFFDRFCRTDLWTESIDFDRFLGNFFFYFVTDSYGRSFDRFLADFLKDF